MLLIEVIQNYSVLLYAATLKSDIFLTFIIAEQLKTNITEDDIPHLTSILSPFAGYWKEIGVQIGFKPHNLAAIQGDLELLSQPGCTGYLNNLLLKWKMCGSSESLSMEALESALCNPTVNLNNIAKELRHDLQMCKEGVYIS